MSQEILIHQEAGQLLVAILEDGRLVQIFAGSGEAPLRGSIYKGKVANLVSSLEAAFVDLGLGKNAFLFIKDVAAWRPGKRIEQLLKRGQEILVQVKREPAQEKGARVTMRLSLPGRSVVYLPGRNQIGVSQRIRPNAERERLRALAAEIKPPGAGLIVRTAASGCTREDLLQDLEGLRRLYDRIQGQAGQVQAPSLIYRESDLLERVIRDYLDGTTIIQVNTRGLWQRTVSAVERLAPALVDCVELSPGDLFSRRDVWRQWRQAVQRKVWLECGGYLVIDQTEALTAIDVNTGRNTGGHDLAETALETNLEAAREIARQIRLREIGGLVVVDFVGTVNHGERQKVLQVLGAELAKDRARTRLWGMTPSGLVEITRQQVAGFPGPVYQRICPCCDGRGQVASPLALALMVRYELSARAGKTGEPAFLVRVHPQVVPVLLGNDGHILEDLEVKVGKQVVLHGVAGFDLERIEILPLANTREPLPISPQDVIPVSIKARDRRHPEDGVAEVGKLKLVVNGAGNLEGKMIPVRIVELGRRRGRAEMLAEVYGPF